MTDRFAKIFASCMLAAVTVSFTSIAPPALAQTPALANFLAAEYFSPIRADVTRPAFWPKRVSFTESNLSEQELRQTLLGSWRGVFTCSGRPVNVEKFKGQRLVDGFYGQSVMYTFTKTHLKRTLFKAAYDNSRDLLPDSRVDSDSPFGLSRAPDGTFKLLGEFSGEYFKAALIQETGEQVLQFESPSHTNPDVCGRNETLDLLMVKDPLS